MSTRYNTGNPIESTDVRDMSDNAKNFDEFSLSTGSTFTDRFGAERLTMEGAIEKTGFKPGSGDFSTGFTVVPGMRNIAWFNPSPTGDNNWYSWSGEITESGKVVPPNSTPSSSGGDQWIPRTDNIISSRSPSVVFANVSDMRYQTTAEGFPVVLSAFPDGARVEWMGYRNQSDGGSNWGILKKGAPPYADDGGSIFVIDANTYVAANLKGEKLNVLKFGMLRDGTNDAISTPSIAIAIAYLTTNNGGGTLYFPSGTYSATINLANKITLLGENLTTIIKGNTLGTNSYTVKASNSAIGVDPQAEGKLPVKDWIISNLCIDANGADFGLYAAYCLFPSITDVTIKKAKVRNLFKAAVYSFSIDKLMLSDCQDAGGSIAENLFGWAGDHYTVNAGDIRRLICYGNGLNGAYNKTTAPKSGAGLIIGTSTCVTFKTFQGEQNKGVGLYVLATCQAVFYGIYLELNGNDGTAEFRQVVNESAASVFYDVQPQFNSTDVFYAAADTTIYNYLGINIKGPGFVSLRGKMANAVVENPLVHTLKMSELLNVDTGGAGASTRHNILRPSKHSGDPFYKTDVYEMGVYISFRAAATIAAGKTVVVRTIDLATTIATIPIPAGNYVDGDTLYMRINGPLIEGKNVVNITYGAGWTGIGFVDIGMYIKLMV